MRQILEHVYCFEDTCYVYIIRSGENAVLIDFGTGDILDHLDEIGVDRVTDILITHHHRDQVQGLPRAVEAGIRIWVPHTEQDLITDADSHWQAREIYNNYNMRQDRFSLLESVPIAGTLRDYEIRQFAGIEFEIVPTPGHTIGSITILCNVFETKLAFSGDLISAPGQVWSMAATQWTYNGAEGVAASIASLLDLKDRQPSFLLPSHGNVIDNPTEAIDVLVERFWQLLQLRGNNPNLFSLREHPYEAITPHLLRHRACVANTYVLVSESKKAMIFDFGYDFVTGFMAGFDRASRRPWLYTIPALKQQFDIETIDVVLPTHFHDDHVAGINLLRRVEGAQVWASDLFADILETPSDYDLPCLWYDPIPVDKVLPLETTIQWEEYSLTLYPLPGHTRYAVAIALEVDGQSVLVTGDQYAGSDGLELNYVYGNRFVADDYVRSASLYRQLNPDLILTGHWQPFRVPEDYFDQIESRGDELLQLHHALLSQDPKYGEEGFLARISPYQISTSSNMPFDVSVEIYNPFHHQAEVIAHLVVPDSWKVLDITLTGQHHVQVSENTIHLTLDSLSRKSVSFKVLPDTPVRQRRARIAIDLTIDNKRFGQQAEALVTTK